jgi:dTDP-4-dehydrorhamnose 3,5-epimerase
MPAINAEPLELAGVFIIRPRRFTDRRGSFCETYHRNAYAAAGIAAEFIQDNEAHSNDAGTIRGLHFQAPPQAQAKLVHVLRGAIFDVAVDLRRGSPTYGKWCGATLTSAAGEQMFVPRGFAHGYCTLGKDALVAYKVDGYYAPALEGGIRWDDAAIGIAWPVAAGGAIVSERDGRLPDFAALKSPF